MRSIWTIMMNMNMSMSISALRGISLYIWMGIQAVSFDGGFELEVKGVINFCKRYNIHDPLFYGYLNNPLDD